VLEGTEKCHCRGIVEWPLKCVCGASLGLLEQTENVTEVSADMEEGTMPL
jgi:hypothetical protein